MGRTYVKDLLDSHLPSEINCFSDVEPCYTQDIITAYIEYVYGDDEMIPVAVKRSELMKYFRKIPEYEELDLETIDGMSYRDLLDIDFPEIIPDVYSMRGVDPSRVLGCIVSRDSIDKYSGKMMSLGIMAELMLIGEERSLLPIVRDIEALPMPKKIKARAALLRNIVKTDYSLYNALATEYDRIMDERCRS